MEYSRLNYKKKAYNALKKNVFGHQRMCRGHISRYNYEDKGKGKVIPVLN
jgi:hypothetical protein